MIFNETTVNDLCDDSLAQAKDVIMPLPIIGADFPQHALLDTWVYERVVRHCLEQELAADGISTLMWPHMRLTGRARIDLVVGGVAIGVRARGTFGDGARRYARYRLEVEKHGGDYLYLARCETHEPYRASTIATFGEDKAFFLDTPGDWARFAKGVKANISWPRRLDGRDPTGRVEAVL